MAVLEGDNLSACYAPTFNIYCTDVQFYAPNDGSGVDVMDKIIDQLCSININHVIQYFYSSIAICTHK